MIGTRPVGPVVIRVERSGHHEAGGVAKEKAQQPRAEATAHRRLRRWKAAVAVEKKRDPRQTACNDAQQRADRAPPEHEDDHLVLPARQGRDDAWVDVARPSAIAVLYEIAQEDMPV